MHFTRPSSDALVGYIGGVGPFYTSTDSERSFDYSQNTKVKFSSTDDTIEYTFPESSHAPTRPPRLRKSLNCLQTSPWIYMTVFCLLLSCVLVYISFLSNEWGEVGRRQRGGKSAAVVVWKFGLWMSCRDDGVCLGLQWPVFYGVCRAFYVLTLFSNSLSLAWVLGHHLEKLLKFDACTMSTISALCICSGIFSLTTVTSFGVYWRDYMISTFPDQVVLISINYAFYVAVATVPLSLLAGLLIIIDMKGSWKRRELEKQLNAKEF